MNEATEELLPKVNDKRQKSRIMQSALESQLIVTIMNFEKSNNYRLKPCEVNKALLSLIESNVEIELKAKLGTEVQW